MNLFLSFTFKFKVYLCVFASFISYIWKYFEMMWIIVDDIIIMVYSIMNGQLICDFG